jgi:hypothetical protein
MTTASPSEMRLGDWAQTYTGGVFWPLDPRPADVRLLDIAHALAQTCRFGGHARFFYSVAQHSVLVSDICDEEDRLWGLLHDAAEAYVGDMIRPLKSLGIMANYRAIEQNVQEAICEKFGLPYGMPPSVQRADNVLLATEARDVMGGESRPWNLYQQPLRCVELASWQPAFAEAQFLTRFAELGGRAES